MQRAMQPQLQKIESREGAARWRRLLSPGGGPAGRFVRGLPASALLGLALLLAFPFTALSLWTGLQTDTPLAYQGLIPLLAFLTAVAHAWRKPSFVWRDGVTEFVVALPFLAAAVGLMYAGSRIGSIYFWYNRGDLLALAMFAIGVAIIMFGVGAITRSWFAIVYLFMLWPAPYQDYLASAIVKITDATVLAVDSGLQRINWTGIESTTGEAVYRVTGPDGAAQYVGVDSPCAGAAGMFGFLVVAIPAMYLTTGRWTRKFAWLAMGLMLLWVLNLGRIFSLFWMATEWGVESPIFWSTHAFLGVILFTFAIALMLFVGYRMGFRFERSQVEEPAAPSMVRIRRTNATPFLALAALALATVLGTMNRDMIDAVGLSSRLADGSPIQTFGATTPTFGGADPRFVDQYDWSKQFFGRNSTYQRFAYPSNGDGQAVWVDSVVTDERERLDLFNVQGCYNFHGFDLAAVSTVEIGHGIVGQQLQFVIPDSGDQWIALSWTWPVLDGREDAHERITILQYVEGEHADDIVEQDGTLSALERLVGLGNGRVSVAPEAAEVFKVAQTIVGMQLGADRAEGR